MQTTPYNLSELQAFIRSLYVTAQYPNPMLYCAPFGFPVSFAALGAGLSATSSLSITGNADFLLLGLAHHVTVGLAAATVSSKTSPLLRLLITDSGTNEQYTNSPVDLENYSTNGGDSRMLPYPRLVQGKTSLTLQLTNYSATEAYTTELFLTGVQIKQLNSGTPAF